MFSPIVKMRKPKLSGVPELPGSHLVSQDEGWFQHLWGLKPIQYVLRRNFKSQRQSLGRGPCN